MFTLISISPVRTLFIPHSLFCIPLLRISQSIKNSLRIVSSKKCLVYFKAFSLSISKWIIYAFPFPLLYPRMVIHLFKFVMLCKHQILDSYIWFKVTIPTENLPHYLPHYSQIMPRTIITKHFFTLVSYLSLMEWIMQSNSYMLFFQTRFYIYYHYSSPFFTLIIPVITCIHCFPQVLIN